MVKRIVLSLLCVAFLCGCSVTVSNSDNTSSNNSVSTTEEQTTTEPIAEPVNTIAGYSVDSIIWGPGNIVEHQQPIDPLKLNKKYLSLDAYWLTKEDKEICLTFDEGYENGFTPQILDVLEDKGVKAMFFVTYDFVESNPDLVERMIKDGHIVGNHTWHHYDMTSVDVETAREEISYLHSYVEDNFDYTMSYFRFPEGKFSEQSLAVVQELGYKSVFWSYAYADWDVDNQADENVALNGILDSTHDSEIILLHAVSSTNANILERMIDEVRRQGYRFSIKI